ncbi:MAG: malate dehydrogenase [Pseudomonadota bacterium]|nr:malate dehydrogenase [Pseudomonadota bacterium]
MQNCVNVSVTGAAGHIGYALVFRIASGAMFGPNVKVRLRLIELESQLAALKGVAMELADCGFSLLEEVICTSDLDTGFADADWAILVGAMPRKKGMERSDLLKINGGIFTEQGLALDRVAAPNAQVLVVGNPCNTNALIASSVVRRLNPRNFYAMTLLDQHRAVGQLSLKSGKAIDQIKSCYIWGNHSATQFPDISNATISGLPAVTVINDKKWLEGEFLRNVQQRGADIIAARGLSSAASAANAAIDSVAACSGLWGEEIFSLAVISNGEYGIDSGIVFSYPCQLKNGSINVVEGFVMDDYASEKIKVTLAELKAERDAVAAHGII